MRKRSGWAAPFAAATILSSAVVAIGAGGIALDGCAAFPSSDCSTGPRVA